MPPNLQPAVFADIPIRPPLSFPPTTTPTTGMHVQGPPPQVQAAALPPAPTGPPVSFGPRASSSNPSTAVLQVQAELPSKAPPTTETAAPAQEPTPPAPPKLKYPPSRPETASGKQQPAALLEQASAARPVMAQPVEPAGRKPASCWKFPEILNLR